MDLQHIIISGANPGIWARGRRDIGNVLRVLQPFTLECTQNGSIHTLNLRIRKDLSH